MKYLVAIFNEAREYVSLHTMFVTRVSRNQTLVIGIKLHKSP